MVTARGPLIELRTPTARLGLLPELGGALAYYDIRRADDWQPVLRPMLQHSADPFDAAMIVLAPWSNRISGGGFHHAGRFHVLSPNLAGQPHPIHGNAFQSAWQIKKQSDTAIDLSLRSKGPGPFDYVAALRYQLTGSSLDVSLSLTHCGLYPLPYGAGFHPWFPRRAATTLTAPVKGVWLETPDHLPAGHLSIAARVDWDFSMPRALPPDWINNCFSGWPGRARIDWPDRHLSCDISASHGLPFYLLYSPDGAADFFCFEPVSHPVDAHQQVDGGDLHLLSRDETLTVGLTFTPVITR
ncbi:MAG TPA: aldose 1-epimerase [Dongiaceae bacterium]